MIEIVGWLGSVFLALCGLPQAIQCWRDGHANGISSSFLALWTSGEILAAAYVIHLGNAPLIVNYLINIISCLVILRYKLKPIESGVK